MDIIIGVLAAFAAGAIALAAIYSGEFIYNLFTKVRR